MVPGYKAHAWGHCFVVALLTLLCGSDSKSLAPRFPRLSILPTTHTAFFPPKERKKGQICLFPKAVVKISCAS